MYDGQLQDSVVVFDTAMLSLKQEQADKLLQTEQYYQSQLEQCVAQCQTSVDSSSEQLAQYQQQYREQIAELKEKYDNTIAQLNAQHQTELNKSADALESYIASRDTEVAELVAKNKESDTAHAQQLKQLQLQVEQVAASDANAQNAKVVETKFAEYKSRNSQKLRQSTIANKQLSKTNDILTQAFDIIDYLATHDYVDKHIVAGILGVDDKQAAVVNKKLVEMNVLTQLANRSRYVRASRGTVEGSEASTDTDKD